MRNRVLALVAAVVLIVGAVLARSVLNDDDGTEVVGGTDTTSAPIASGTVICIEELREQCAAIEGATIEPAGTTIERLSTDENAEAPSAWVTFAPLQGALDEARRVRGLSPLFVAAERLATTRLVLVVRADRGAVLKATCADVTWKCVGDNASASWESLGGDARWGQPKIGHGAPDETALGAIVFAWEAAGYFEGADVVLENDDFRTWLSQVERAVQPASLTAESPTQLMVTQLGSLDIVATSEVEVGRVVAEGDTRFTIYPSEVAIAEVVVATTGGEVPSELTDDLRAALADAGWESAKGESTAVPGLPGAGVVEALRTRIWDEVK